MSTEQESVRPGSKHDWEKGGGPLHEDPDDPTTAVGFLKSIYRKVGRLETEADQAREDRRAHERLIDTNKNANRAVQTALEAQGRTLEQFATEMRGTLAGIARTHSAIAADLAPVLATHTQWGKIQALAARVAIGLGALGGIAAGAIKVVELIRAITH